MEGYISKDYILDWVKRKQMLPNKQSAYDVLTEVAGVLALNSEPNVMKVIKCKDCRHGNIRGDGEIVCVKNRSSIPMDNGTFNVCVDAPLVSRDWYCGDAEPKEEVW